MKTRENILVLEKNSQLSRKHKKNLLNFYVIFLRFLIFFFCSLTRENFEQIVNAICTVFPNEAPEVFYLRPTSGKPAKGKLYNAYSNAKLRGRTSRLVTSTVHEQYIEEFEDPDITDGK
jgi:hypothetical protein